MGECSQVLGLAIVIQLLVFSVVSFWVIPMFADGHRRIKFAQKPYRATVDSAVLVALDVTSKPPNSTSAVRYDLSVDLRIRNRDFIRIWFTDITAVPFYNGSSMLSVPQIWPHTPSGRGRPKNKVAWQKIAFQGTVAVPPAVAGELERERAAGTVHLRLRVSVRIKRKIWLYASILPRTIYGAYNCWLWFPTPQPGAPAVFDAGTRCFPEH